MVPAWLRIRDIPEYCGISKRLVGQWMRDGLRFSRVRGVILIKREWLDAYIEDHAESSNKVDNIVSEVLEGVTGDE